MILRPELVSLCRDALAVLPEAGSDGGKQQSGPEHSAGDQAAVTKAGLRHGCLALAEESKDGQARCVWVVETSPHG
jgi:hypothetical protein